ncbi:uncharacterized protein LOC123673943 [Harmonia axyridis]|uniref:uncharacterized protein LOC123673943 n=1 Tax=Harmonia axyridis TaxID=115357 RepID=UPI001E275207|nr:uncharacterized protein LOC123673943 [Harmonia axyridis]
MKLLSLLLLILPLIDSYVESAAVRAGVLPHNLYECDPTKPRIRVLSKLIQKPGRPRTIVNEAFQYPRIQDLSPDLSSRIITCISVEDLSRNGKGGYADIVAGGINTNFVNLIFESQPGEDILFSVTIYSYYPGTVLSAGPKNVPAAPPV